MELATEEEPVVEVAEDSNMTAALLVGRLENSSIETKRKTG